MRGYDMRHAAGGASLNEQERLFLSLAEELARPFLTVSRLSEFAAANDPQASQQYWQAVRTVADASLRLVESYSLSLRVHGKVTPLQLEPVTVSSLLYDTADRLKPFAGQYGIEIKLDTGPRVQPVMADRTVLQSAFESLGQVFVLAQAEAEERGSVHLMAHRSRHGAVAGLYGGSAQLGVDSLRRARLVQGRARQPLYHLTSGPAAGVFIADKLLHSMAAHLHVARYHHLNGLAATLQPSRQLQLV